MHHDIIATLEELIIKKLQFLHEKEELIFASEHKISVEKPKNEQFGDFSCNAAMVLSKINKKNPLQIGEKICAELQKESAIFAKVEVIRPGFINFFLQKQFLLNKFAEIFNYKENFSKNQLWQNQKINLEFVSANPTGPMHIGHVRGAILGDIMANLCAKMSAKVTREYYINDAGAQINTLLQSVWLRMRELRGEKISMPENCYPGEYIIDVAKEILRKNSQKTNDLNYSNSKNQDSSFDILPENNVNIFQSTNHKDNFYQDFEDFAQRERDFIVQKIMQMIKDDLALLKVRHDIFTSEAEIQKRGLLDDAMQILQEKNLLYHGSLPKPQGKSDPEWEEREQLLFKSTEFGDEVDRALQKSDNSYTYFAGDLAYHFDKCQRDFAQMFLVLGVDHIGYDKRIRAAVSALSEGKKQLKTIFAGLVNFLQDGQKIKMSKRSGKFLTARDVVEAVGVDALRFMMVWKSSEAVLNFDFEAVLQQSKENPVFYVQYAHTRCCSILKNFPDNQLEEITQNCAQFLPFLQEKEEKELIKKILLWPQIVKKATLDSAPHLISNFLFEISSIFHTLWSLGRDDLNRKFILPNNQNLTNARILLTLAMQTLLQDGLQILNIEPVREM